MREVLVLGAGITGVATAYLLARDGWQVQVIDRQPQAALETTFANGGQISVSHAEPWAHPGAPIQVLQWLAQPESPLYFSPRLEWRQWVWLADWLWQCRRSAADRNTVAIVNIALRSRELYQSVREREGIEYQLKTLGILHFYRDRSEYENACRMAELMTRAGCERIPVTKAEIDRLEPTLAQNYRIVGGTYTPHDESGNARLFTQSLARISEAQYGVRFRYGTVIDELVAREGRIEVVKVSGPEGVEEELPAGEVVLCLGPYSPLVAQKLGIFLNIYPAKGYSISVPLDERNAPYAPRISLTDDENKLVFSNLETHLRVAGTAELAGWDTTLSYYRVKPIVEKAAGLFPAVFAGIDIHDREAVTSELNPWTGLRPTTPSNVPYVGRAKQYENLWLNTGHGTLGWTMGMGTAEMIATLLRGTL